MKHRVHSSIFASPKDAERRFLNPNDPVTLVFGRQETVDSDFAAVLTFVDQTACEGFSGQNEFAGEKARIHADESVSGPGEVDEEWTELWVEKGALREKGDGS